MSNENCNDPVEGTILLVDDQPEGIDVIKFALDKFFSIKIATRGELAIKAANLGGIDLILMDIVMPGMNGYEVCRHLKSNLSTKNIPIIFLTSKDEPEDEAIGLALGAVDFIRKPSSPSVVLARSRNTIAYQRAKNDLLAKNDELQHAIKVREAEIEVRQKIEDTLQQKQEELSQKSDLLETILGNLQQGLVACDKDMRLIVCNRRFKEIRGIPEELTKPGTPFAGWVRYDEELGDFSHDLSEDLVARPRIQDKSAQSHDLERVRPDGTVIQIQGGELPDGGFVSTFTDITENKLREADLKKLSIAVEHSPVSVVVTDANGTIEYVNEKFTSTTGYTVQDVLGNKTNILSSGKTEPEKYKEMWATLLAGKLWHGVLLNRKKNGDIYWKEISISPIKDDYGKIVNFVSTGEDITKQKKLQEERADAMRLINSSIKYASRIQRSILPPVEALESAFLEHFILWKPRDTVGGDMYWLRSWGSGTLILLGDCTGHGVPGAFMTLISNGALDEAYLETPPGDPATLLQRMHQLIQFSLGQDRAYKENSDDDEGPNDGIEVGACYLNGSEGTITFAGARFDLFIMKNGEVETIKGVKAGLGYRNTPKDVQFTNHEIEISSNHTYYMASDGLIDQVGGDKMRGFGKKRFKSLLVSMAEVPLADQYSLILKALDDYQGDQKRRDDVTVIGFKGFEADGQITNRDLIEMDHTMLVDFKPLDDDHKRLFGLANKLNNSIVRGHDKAAVIEVLDDLISYTAWHFRHEERLMQISSYPKSIEHKETHGKLIDQALKIQHDIKENDADVSTDLMVFLLDWLNGHIHNVDKHLADHLNSIDTNLHNDAELPTNNIDGVLADEPSTQDFFVLDDSLLVGFGPIDDDHRKLVDLINKLHVTVADVHNKGASMRALDSLVDYTAWHFRHEERLMQSNDYPDMAKHKIEHGALISQVNQIQNKFRADDDNAPAELNLLLKNWLINHIHEVDNKLAAFMMTK